MMTREEAISIIERVIYTEAKWPGTEDTLEALDLALSALHSVSREQLEKVLGSGGWETVPDKGFVDTMGRQVYHLHCPHCDFFWRETSHAKYFRFCPNCGAPMTGEAVEMVRQRLEELKDGL